MNILKLILAAIGLVFVGMLLLWVLGFIGSILSYVFWIGLIAAIGYGGYRLFLKIEDKALGPGSRDAIGSGNDINMSWDEYERKYLRK